LGHRLPELEKRRDYAPQPPAFYLKINRGIGLAFAFRLPVKFRAGSTKMREGQTMKYQFQFAGANVRRTSPPQRKGLRLGMLSALFVLSALAYWHYLYHMTHARAASQAHAAVAVATIPKPAQSEEPPAKLPPALKKAANAGANAIGTYIAESLKIAQPPALVAPVAEVQPPAQAIPPALVLTGYKIVSAPVATAVQQRAPRVLTPEQKMNRAAQAALARMLNQANKYPDAYGFLPEDDFAEVKLGNPIPVYSVLEKDRAAYQPGAEVKPLLKPTQQWVFPVLAGDRICCMVRVSFNGHDYIPGDASKSLALAWNKISASWPEADGFHPLLVVNPRIPGFFFTVPEASTPNLTDTDRMFAFHPDLSRADVILASWR
jgi:hypothetical protein